LINIGLINPSERDIHYNVSRRELLSMIPDLTKRYPELAGNHGEQLIADLRSREGLTFQIYFNTSAVLLSENGFSHDSIVIGQPIQWKKIIQLTNPGSIRYENVTWNVSVYPKAYDCTIDGSIEGELSEGMFRYTEPVLDAGQKRSTPLFITPPCEKTEETVSSGLIKKTIEKRITLVNDNDETITLLVYTAISDVPNYDTDALKEELGSYVLADKDGDGTDDVIKWNETLYPGEIKSIVINGKTMGLFYGVPAVIKNLYKDSIDTLQINGGITLIFAAIAVLLIAPLFLIRYVRHERRHRMLSYLSAIEGALKGSTSSHLPGADKK